MALRTLEQLQTEARNNNQKIREACGNDHFEAMPNLETRQSNGGWFALLIVCLLTAALLIATKC
jgi:hypothetical protein